MSAPRLSARLRQATQPLHTRAERSGIMAALLRGEIDRPAYCLLLRNLHALYETLERALDRHAGAPAVAPVRIPALYRAQALRGDLQFLHGSDWAALPLAAAMQDYCGHVEALRDADAGLLAAHAYVRYLGDLSGGQILRPLVRRALRLEDGVGIAFYAFGSETEVEALKRRLRDALDALPVDAAGAAAIVVEADAAFTRHIRLFEELEALRAACAPGAAQ